MQTMEKAVDIEELRSKLDKINEEILSCLKHRARYNLNKGIYTELFADGKTWFLYRLKKVQDIDSEYGRYLYNDQIPFVYSKQELVQSRINAPANNMGMKPIQIDLSNEIISAYQKVLSGICRAGENKSTYGETTKLDVENILAINERIAWLGEQVAGYKMQENHALLKLKSRKEIEKELTYAKREKEVIDTTV